MTRLLSLSRITPVLLLSGLLMAQSAVVESQIVVTSLGDPIQLVNGVNDGDTDSGPPPNAEGVGNAIDGTTSKYLNFLDLNSGFIVTPSAGATVVNMLRLYTANDQANRDPASFLLEGSNSGVGGQFSLIAQGQTNLPVARNAAGLATQSGQQSLTAGLAFADVTFANTTAYTTYRLIFPTLRNAGSVNSMQIGEAQLIGAAVPAPSSLAIMGTAGCFGLGSWLRRRKRVA